MTQTVHLTSAAARDRAVRLVLAAPDYAVVTVSAERRSLDQNALLWALLSDIAIAKPEGRSWPPEIWKSAFMAAFGYEVKWQPGLDGKPPFPTDYRTSRMNKTQMSELLEFIREYGARHGVKFLEDA